MVTKNDNFLYTDLYKNIKQGVVFTPKHIAELMKDLLQVPNKNFSILDPAAGIGNLLKPFLNENCTIYGCENNIEIYKNCDDQIKQYIQYCDFFDKDTKINLKTKNIEYGILNPPFTQNNKLEFEFITSLLNLCSNKVIGIFPKGFLWKNQKLRENLLKKHSILAIIKLPKNIYAPMVSIETYIILFRCNIPHNYENSIYFKEILDDGYKLVKTNRVPDLTKKDFNNIKNEILFEYKITNNHTYLMSNKDWLNKNVENCINFENLNDDIMENIILNYYTDILIKNKIIQNKNFTIKDIPNILTYLKTHHKDVDIKNVKLNYKLYTLPVTNLWTFQKNKIIHNYKNIEPGTIAYLTASKKNNSIYTYIKPMPKDIIFQNKFTFSSLGYISIFYHNYPFIPNNKHVFVFNFKNEVPNQYIDSMLIFLNYIYFEYGQRFNFNRNATLSIVNSTIVTLPCINNFTLDYEYIFNFIEDKKHDFIQKLLYNI